MLAAGAVAVHGICWRRQHVYTKPNQSRALSATFTQVASTQTQQRHSWHFILLQELWVPLDDSCGCWCSPSRLQVTWAPVATALQAQHHVGGQSDKHTGFSKHTATAV